MVARRDLWGGSGSEAREGEGACRRRGSLGAVNRWQRPLELPSPSSVGRQIGASTLLSHHYRSSKRSSKYEPDEDQHLVDEKILESSIGEVRVVSEDGTHEVLSVKKALARSKKSNLNLVVVNQNASPPVCRLMDYSYFKFNQTKKEKERKKPENKPKKRKEVLVSTKISSGHLEMKYNTILGFLEKKHPVKITAVDARGDDLKETFLTELKKKMETDGYVISQPVKIDQARKASIIVSPKKS